MYPCQAKDLLLLKKCSLAQLQENRLPTEAKGFHLVKLTWLQDKYQELLINVQDRWDLNSQVLLAAILYLVQVAFPIEQGSEIM